MSLPSFNCSKDEVIPKYVRGLKKTYPWIAWLLLVIIQAGSQPSLFAQQAQASLEPAEIDIGQQAMFILEIEVPADGLLVIPSLSDTLDIEVLRRGLPDTLHIGDGMMALRQEHVITAWEADFIPIPPLRFKHLHGPDTIAFETRPLLLQVRAVELDPEAGYRDIKSIIALGRDWRGLLFWLAIILLTLTALYFLLRRIRKRKPVEKPPDIWEKPDVPAHIAAISSLETLRSKQLWQKGKYKVYHSELSEILRRYIWKRFGVHALEMTTAELMERISGHLEDREQHQVLEMILGLADLVKFARHIPVEREHDRALDEALAFVKATMEVPGEQEKP